METSGICKDICNSLMHRSLSGAEHLKQNPCVLSSELCLGMEDTLARYYGHHSNKVEKPVRPCVALEIENTNWKMLCNEVYDQAHELRQMKGEDLEGLNVEELEQLEKKLEAGLSLVIKTKSEHGTRSTNCKQRKHS